jgi:hypothetical protein
MKEEAGLWIDHHHAIIVFVRGGAEETKKIESDVKKHVRFSGGNRTEDGAADDQRDRQFAAHLARYYDEVISQIRDADSILIFGPGEAKGELGKRLASKKLGDRIVATETTDKMTLPQIAAKVREYFKTA